MCFDYSTYLLSGCALYQHEYTMGLFEMSLAVATRCFGLESVGLLKGAWKKLWGPTRKNITTERWNSLGEESS